MQKIEIEKAEPLISVHVREQALIVGESTFHYAHTVICDSWSNAVDLQQQYIADCFGLALKE